MKYGKYSVRMKMILLTFAAIFGTVALCIILNETFLVRYYETSKKKTLGEVYLQIDNLVSAEGGIDFSGGETSEDRPGNAKGSDTNVEDSGVQKPDTVGISEKLRLELDRLCTKYNIAALILEDILSDRTSPQDMDYYYFGPGGENNQDELVIRELIGDYFFPGYGEELKGKQLETETERYSIYSLYDTRMESNYIELVGYLNSGEIILMRSNVESMQESIAVANKFLVYAGVVSAVVISVVMFFVSSRFTRPILKLADISKKMSELNFDVKYEAKSKDEIGTLGHSMNVLSEKLEKTISELKTANNELMLDIDRKTQAEEVRKEFLSNVTHELKTPIAVIQGYAEGLRENISESPEDRAFYCDVIVDEAAKMNTMVKKLLTLNQLEYGTTPLDFCRFDLTEVIRLVLASMDILAKQKGITLHFEQTEPVYVWADEYMIEEVLTNYISNAFHHTTGVKIVEVKIIPRKDVVRVAVFNTGEKIPEEALQHVWIKFYKVDKARTREYGGSGIGLSIVKAIMEAHNRPYGVKNHATGVEFWFELERSAESQN